MNEYNSKNIIPFKGRMVELTYKVKGRIKNGAGHIHSIVGEISATTKYTIIFNSGRSGTEIPLKYFQIIDIKCPEKV